MMERIQPHSFQEQNYAAEHEPLKYEKSTVEAWGEGEGNSLVRTADHPALCAMFPTRSLDLCSSRLLWDKLYNPNVKV